jgi:hypothetical protein
LNRSARPVLHRHINLPRVAACKSHQRCWKNYG